MWKPEVVQLKCGITIVVELKFRLPKSSPLNGVFACSHAWCASVLHMLGMLYMLACLVCFKKFAYFILHASQNSILSMLHTMVCLACFLKWHAYNY